MNRAKLLLVVLIASIYLAGCGPTLQDSKTQYVITVNSAKTTLDILTVLKQANKLTSGEVNAIDVAVDKFDLYRAEVRAALDANIPAPVNARNGMAAALTEFVQYEIEKEGVK
jgi:hypothetical protein